MEQSDSQSGATPNPIDEHENESDLEGQSESELESEPELESEEENRGTQDESLGKGRPESDSQEPVGEFPGNLYTCEERDGNPTNMEHLKLEQERDNSLRTLREMGRERKNRYFYSQQGILCRSGLDHFGEEVTQLVLPKSQRRKAFRASHSTLISGHLNYKTTVKKLIPYFTWPGLYSDIRQWCAACTTCQQHNPGNGDKAPLHPLPVVRTPWSWIAFDLVGPLQRTKRGNKFLLTCIDLSTRYPEAILVKGTDLKQLIDPLFTIL